MSLYNLNLSPSLFVQHNPAPNKSRLFIESVDFAEYPNIRSIVEAWEKIAENKIQMTDPVHEKGAFDQLHSAKTVAKLIAQELSCSPKKGNIMLICKNAENEEIHGVASVSKYGSLLEGSLLLTKPIHIRCTANRAEKQLAGVGTAFMNLFDKIQLTQGIDKIRLTPSHSAVEFYQKFGFEGTTTSMVKVRTISPSKL